LIIFFIFFKLLAGQNCLFKLQIKFYSITPKMAREHRTVKYCRNCLPVLHSDRCIPYNTSSGLKFTQ